MTEPGVWATFRQKTEGRSGISRGALVNEARLQPQPIALEAPVLIIVVLPSKWSNASRLNHDAMRNVTSYLT